MQAKRPNSSEAAMQNESAKEQAMTSQPEVSNVGRFFNLVQRQTPRYRIKRLSLTAGCGFPSPAADCEDERVTLDELLVRRPLSSFLAEVEGDAMIDAGICAGDILVIDRAVKAKNGSIVLAVLNGEFMIRRLRVDPHGKPELHAENDSWESCVIRPGEGEQFDIEGVAVGLTRQLQ